MKNVLLVARREISVGVRMKSYIVSLIVMSVAAVALMVVPTLLSGLGDDELRVAVGGENAAELTESLERLAAEEDVELVVEESQDPEAAVSAEDSEVDAGLVDDATVVYSDRLDPELGALLEQAHREVQLREQLETAGLGADEAEAALTTTPLKEKSLAGDDTAVRQAIAYVVIIVLFFFIIMTTMSVAMGVVEEKSSRIVEILLASIRPWELLTGKILGLGVLGLGNLAVPALLILISGGATGALSTLPAGVIGVILSAVGWWVLGYLFFAALAGSLASLVSRQEEVSSAVSPMTMVMVGCYAVSSVLLWQPTSTLSQILSYVPPISMLMMPVRGAAGEAAVWEQLLSAGILAAAAVGVFALGAAIYKRNVMRTGVRIKFSKMFAKN